MPPKKRGPKFKGQYYELEEEKQTDVAAELINIGVTPTYLARKTKELIEAVQEKANYDSQRGKWTYSKALKALEIQTKAMDIALRVSNSYPIDEHKVIGEVRRSPEELKELREMAQKIVDEMKQRKSKV